MDRVVVVSSMLASVGYEDGILEAEFVGGALYRYFDVPDAVHGALMAAASHGTFFNERIRGVYRYVRL